MEQITKQKVQVDVIRKEQVSISNKVEFYKYKKQMEKL